MKPSGSVRLDVVPVTQPVANAYVEKWHRHHAAIPGGFAWFCLAAVARGVVVGVAICGRPTNRNNDNRQTVEVLRLATDGTPNACSALLGAAAKTAQAMGACRIITYTLTEESGSSLRGAGWACESEDTGRSWWTSGKTRPVAVDREHMSKSKSRWGKVFRDPVLVAHESAPPLLARSTRGAAAVWGW